ncbi:hypothetical protein BLNAU_22739 [Blattamonas nauphoetae]|uniref:Uncharacterized protein n=1 Tax=Blattamonas nauphoetae TaxID=2049346 RepID=A0ABQ9WS85_9EUKA|nr:hypothetical protein BLNAU_22739 [Blattamonas nauphoetae]
MLSHKANQTAFTMWDRKQLESIQDYSTLFRSLVQMIKDGHPFDDAMTKKAVFLLEEIHFLFVREYGIFIYSLVPSSPQKSVQEFVDLIAVFISSANQPIIQATLKVIVRLINRSSPTLLLLLINADLISRIVSSLLPISLPFSEAQELHSNLLVIVRTSLWLVTPQGLETLKQENQKLHDIQEAVLKHILVPSKKYIGYVCGLRHSLVNSSLSNPFSSLLICFLKISPSHPPTLDFIQTLPIALSISSFLTFSSSNVTIKSFLDELNVLQTEWFEQDETICGSGTVVTRLLTREGFSDVLEQLMMTDKKGDNRGSIMEYSISLSDLFGMNIRDLEYGFDTIDFHFFDDESTDDESTDHESTDDELADDESTDEDQD